MSRPLRIAFDIGGVISKYPDLCRQLIWALDPDSAEIHVITDMHDREQVLAMLERNGLGWLEQKRVHCADYDKHGEGCKAVLCRELEIDIILDDFVGYVAVPGAPIRCLVMPDATRPYYADSWRTIGNEGSFGRRVFVEPTDQEDEDRFLSEMANECRCCGRCTVIPCPGLTQGGFCDEACSCGDESR